MLSERIIVVLSVLLLAACGSTGVRERADGTFTVSAQFGSINGSWERASGAVNDEARTFCSKMGKEVAIVEEVQDGTYGFTPQRAILRFNCID